MSDTGDLFGGHVVPQTDDEWNQLDFRAADIFSPHAPIDEEQLLAGRIPLIDGLIETVFQRGQHAILYGERGVGKTSLANILQAKVFAKSRRYMVIKRNCTAAHNYKTIWQQLFDDFKLPDGDSLSDVVDHSSGAYEIFRAIERFRPNQEPIFVIDEYDRIQDESTHVKMADTIKYLSDYSAKATLIIVGVARDVKELFGGHPSIERNVRQLPVPVMTLEELALIFARRLPELGMTMEAGTLGTLIRLAQGLPGYTHLLGQNATRNAIKRRSLEIKMEDLNASMYKSIEACDEKIKDLYDRAVRSTKPGNLYKQALLACALATVDQRGYFSTKSVQSPFAKIMKKRVEIQNFTRHLTEFCEPDHGPALIKEGRPRSYVFRFSDALLRPFVVLKGMQDKMIPRQVLQSAVGN